MTAPKEVRGSADSAAGGDRVGRPGPVDGGAPTFTELVDDIADLVRVVEELRLERDHDRALFDELTAQFASGVLGGSTLLAGAPVYEAWTDWVDEWLVPRIDRSPHRHRWCDRYADHLEVADRLEALWVTWETAWPNGAARSAWLRDHLHHHWPVVTSEDGPLRDCAVGAHHDQLARS